MGSTTGSRRHHIARPLPHPRLSGTGVPPRGTVYVVERLGRFSRLLHSSTSATPLLPLVDKVVAAYSTRRVEQSTSVNGLHAHVAGRTPVYVHATWTTRVLDPKRLAYRISNVDRCVQMLVHMRIKDAFAALPLSALSALASPSTLTAMSESVRQSIDETAQKFGVSCPAFAITSVNRAPEREAPRYPVLYYPQPAQPLNGVAEEQPPQPPVQKQRSLNLAAEPVAGQPAADHDDLESVLPELPGEAHSLKNALPASFIDDESDDDDALLDDSSIENRPPEKDLSKEPPLPQEVSSKQSLSADPPAPKEVLYAPPPSPSLSEGDIRLSEEGGLDALPALLSRVLANRPQVQDIAVPKTDSLNDKLPPPPPLTVLPHSLSRPPQAEEDFAPALAKYLNAQQSTPTTDLPSSENSEEVANKQMVSPHLHAVPAQPSKHDEIARSASLDDKMNDVELEHTDRTVTANMAANEGRLPTTDGNGLSLAEKKSHFSGEVPLPGPVEIPAQNPFDSIDGHSLSETTSARSPPPYGQKPPKYDSDQTSNEAVSDKDMTGNPAPQSNLIDSPKNTPELKNSPVNVERAESVQVPNFLDSNNSSGPSIHSELRNPGEELLPLDQDSNESVDQGVNTPKARAATYRKGELRFQGRDAESRSERAELHFERPANGMRIMSASEAVPTSRVSVERSMMRDDEAPVMDVRRKRNLASVSDYEPTGKSLTSPSIRNFDKYDRVPRQNGTKVTRNVTRTLEDAVVDRRLPVLRTGDVDEMEANSDLLGRKRGRKGSGWLRSREEEERLGRREHARREKLRGALDEIERGRHEPYVNGDSSPDERMPVRGAVPEATSDSDHEIFHDAHDDIAPATSSVQNRRYGTSKRRHKPRHRRVSRHEQGYFAGSSSSEDVCEECTNHRHYEPYHHEEAPQSRSRSRSKSESSRRRIYEDEDDSQSEAPTEIRSTSSRSRSRSGRSSHDVHRSESSSRDRSHRSKKSSSRDKRRDHIEKPERSLRSDRERESSRSRGKSTDRKRSHEKSSNKSSSRKSSYDEPEKRRRDGKNSKSRSKHRKTHSPSPLDYTNKYRANGLKSIYRHRLPDSDSGIENPIPWYCEGQSAPDDTDLDIGRGHDSSDSDTGVADSIQQSSVYSSYGRRDKYGHRRRARHNRTVTFLYDDL